jgi:hypothetical protein
VVNLIAETIEETGGARLRLNLSQDDGRLRQQLCLILLAPRPTKLSRRNAYDLTELASHVTLVRKPHGKCNLRQGEIRMSQHVLRSFDPFLREIMVRGTPADYLNSLAK